MTEPPSSSEWVVVLGADLNCSESRIAKTMLLSRCVQGDWDGGMWGSFALIGATSARPRTRPMCPTGEGNQACRRGLD